MRASPGKLKAAMNLETRFRMLYAMVIFICLVLGLLPLQNWMAKYFGERFYPFQGCPGCTPNLHFLQAALLFAADCSGGLCSNTEIGHGSLCTRNVAVLLGGADLVLTLDGTVWKRRSDAPKRSKLYSAAKEGKC